LRLLAQRALGRSEITVTDRATGLRFRCLRGADRMLGETFHSQVYDIPTVPVRAGDLVIDVGANHGFSACWFARRDARVVAFEPDPTVHGLLVANVAANGLADRIQTFQCAVGGDDGHATLLVSPELGGGMSTLHPELAVSNHLDITARIDVEVRGLPGILRELGSPRVRLLKLDCEGSELAILRSLDRAVLDSLDSLAIEYHPAAYELPDLIDTVLGWDGFHLSKALTLDVSNANLHAASSRAVAAWARSA